MPELRDEMTPLSAAEAMPVELEVSGPNLTERRPEIDPSGASRTPDSTLKSPSSQQLHSRQLSHCGPGHVNHATTRAYEPALDGMLPACAK